MLTHCPRCKAELPSTTPYTFADAFPYVQGEQMRGLLWTLFENPGWQKSRHLRASHEPLKNLQIRILRTRKWLQSKRNNPYEYRIESELGKGYQLVRG